MRKIIGVRFKTAGKMYYFDPNGFQIERGDHVIVETSRGIEYGEVVAGIKEIDESNVIKPLKGVIRIATKDDTKRYEENKSMEKEAFNIFCEQINAHNIDMKLVEVEYSFERNKILFYFTADGRVDFRDLVKDLAAIFKIRIELRQIGVRDESKTLGSIGVCGRNLCCSQFLSEFVPVSIRMAKEQGLSLNPAKISGACGRLMCCLKYEQDTYEELIRTSPSVGAEVMTPEGPGTVISTALLTGMVRVRLELGDEVTMKDFSVQDIDFGKNGVQSGQNENDDILDALDEEIENQSENIAGHKRGRRKQNNPNKAQQKKQTRQIQQQPENNTEQSTADGSNTEKGNRRAVNRVPRISGASDADGENALPTAKANKHPRRRGRNNVRKNRASNGEEE